MRNVIAVGGLILLAIAPVAADQSQRTGKAGPASSPEWIGMRRAEIRKQRVQGRGRWKPNGRRRGPPQRWSADLAFDGDGRVHGSVNVDDSVLFASGRIEGVIKGRRVAGTIFDERDEPVAKVNGVITPDGLSGSYTDRSGGNGEWVWDGPLPQ